jgi:tRNA-splicing endonuclease subunit Sen54
MPLDDDDNPSLAPPPTTSSTTSPSAPTTSTTTTTPTPADDLTPEDLIEDEGAAAQDFRAFAAALGGGGPSSSQYRKTAGVSAQTIRRGEKDFEAHGTRVQADALEQSRGAMRDVLSYTRVHTTGGGGAGGMGGLVRGWFFPGWWEGFCEEGEEGEGERKGEGEKKPFGFVRERVVVLEGSSVASQALGRAVTGQAKDRPARGRDWLLPEEALYLVERGSLDLWWPLKELEEIFPPEGAVAAAGAEEGEVEEVDEYDAGIPLSLQAAYALLIGNDGERGKISLQKFQVYSNLKRCGYNVLRAPPIPTTLTTPQPSPTTTLWQWFSSLLTSTPPPPAPYGPLVQPGLYRSYAAIYRQMALLPRHKPSLAPSNPQPTQDPFQIHFHIWKASQKWTKLRHPAPDFRLAIVDAQQSCVPSLSEITALLDATPPAPGKPEWTGPGRMYARLKHGYRNVLVAVVDHGVINYMRFAEGLFGQEEVFARFDFRGGGGKGRGGGAGFGGKKGGGRNNGRGGVTRGRGGGGRGRGGGGR